MTKRIRRIDKIIEILRIPPKSPPTPVESNLRLEGILAVLVPHLMPLAPGFRILDSRFPIREGGSKIDLIACDQAGDLILIWVVERLSDERLFRLIPDYDWVKKNFRLWPHLFPQVKRAGLPKFHVWIVAREVDPQIPSLLSYLKGIEPKLLHDQRVRQGNRSVIVLNAWQKGPTLSPISPPENSSTLSPPNTPSAPLTAEEVKDLMSNERQEGVNYEDEITDPYCPISELK